MELNTVKDWLRGFQFRALTEFRCSARQEGSGWMVDIAISYPTINSRRPSEPYTTQAVYTVPSHTVYRHEFLDWVRQCLKDMACHEVDEFIIVDGKRMFDPHQ